MSAFIISEKTMHLCVRAMLDEGKFVSHREKDDMGKELFAMNQRAVQARYGKRDDGYDAVPDYRYQSQLPDRVSMFKALECLLYQCSEGDVPEEKLYIRVSEKRDELAREIVRHSKEYERCEAWS